MSVKWWWEGGGDGGQVRCVCVGGGGSQEGQVTAPTTCPVIGPSGQGPAG